MLAVPVAVGVALFITQYAPRRLASRSATLIDLLAAIPSIIYGLWGIRVLGPVIAGPDPAYARSSRTTSAGSRCFDETGVAQGTVFLAAIVLAIMILPIITAISREVFAQTPRAQHRGRAGARRDPLGDDPHRGPAVRPARRDQRVDARPGPRARRDDRGHDHPVASRSSLEKFDLSVFFGGETFASKIANNASEFATPQKTGAYIAAGLVLFVITFAVNAVARIVISRSARED